MPEGDTVLQAARTLDHALAGQIVRRSDFRVPKLAVSSLVGQTVLEVKPRGKHMLLRTDGGLTLQTHFMMDGAWMLYAPGAAWRGPAHEIRVVVATDPWVAVGYRLKIVELFPTVEEGRRLGGLGPDLLGPDWDLAEALRRLMLRPERPICEALLDQTCLAGIGNIYRSEALFMERINPWTPVAEVRNLASLVERARKLMQLSVRNGRQCTTGTPRDPFWVFNRLGKPCRRCRVTAIERREGESSARLLDADAVRETRVTWWCPRCQAAEASK